MNKIKKIKNWYIKKKKKNSRITYWTAMRGARPIDCCPTARRIPSPFRHRWNHRQTLHQQRRPRPLPAAHQPMPILILTPIIPRDYRKLRLVPQCGAPVRSILLGWIGRQGAQGCLALLLDTVTSAHPNQEKLIFVNWRSVDFFHNYLID